MYDPQAPLDARELRIIRGMIDEYEYNRIAARERGEFWTRTKIVSAAIAGILVVVMQFAALMLSILYHG